MSRQIIIDQMKEEGLVKKVIGRITFTMETYDGTLHAQHENGSAGFWVSSADKTIKGFYMSGFSVHEMNNMLQFLRELAYIIGEDFEIGPFQNIEITRTEISGKEIKADDKMSNTPHVELHIKTIENENLKGQVAVYERLTAREFTIKQ